jgi:hypothetical protein
LTALSSDQGGLRAVPTPDGGGWMVVNAAGEVVQSPFETNAAAWRWIDCHTNDWEAEVKDRIGDAMARR